MTKKDRDEGMLLDRSYRVVDPLSPWTGFAVMCAFAGVPIGLAAWRLDRADA